MTIIVRYLRRMGKEFWFHVYASSKSTSYLKQFPESILERIITDSLWSGNENGKQIVKPKFIDKCLCLSTFASNISQEHRKYMAQYHVFAKKLMGVPLRLTSLRGPQNVSLILLILSQSGEFEKIKTFQIMDPKKRNPYIIRKCCGITRNSSKHCCMLSLNYTASIMWESW